jgi:hypothetical protein
MESLPLLLILLLLTFGSVIFIIQIIRNRQRKKRSMSGWIAGGIALIPIAITTRWLMIHAGTEYNPVDATRERIAGHYAEGDASLTLQADGTYTSHNLNGLTAGTWSHFDWNLNFSKSTLQQARWITICGKPAILPYYAGPDASPGLVLQKQIEYDSDD